jgi:flagellar biosynthesis/type III secretory pathway chaperone
MKSQIALMDDFIESLRNELQGYGELLALMESQQSRILSRDTPKIESSAHEINSQFSVIQSLKSNRQKSQAALSISLGLLPDALYVDQRKHLPEDLKNLTDALVEENNSLLNEVRLKARQNQLLLYRTVEIMQEFINQILPRTEIKSYDSNGQKKTKVQSKLGLYEAVG